MHHYRYLGGKGGLLDCLLSGWLSMAVRFSFLNLRSVLTSIIGDVSDFIGGRSHFVFDLERIPPEATGKGAAAPALPRSLAGGVDPKGEFLQCAECRGESAF